MRDAILIVDDVEINRDMLESILESEYGILTACDGDQAMALIESRNDEIAAILLDLLMPGKDGYEVLTFLKEKNLLNSIPVLVISAEDSPKSEKKCFSMGVSDFVHKPFDRDLVRARVNNVVNLYQYKEHLEDKVEEQTRIIRKRNTKIIELLGSVVETRNLESGAHVQRVKGYTKILAYQMMEKYEKYKLTPEYIDIIVAASALHDVGKIAIPDSILLKPGKLTDEEFEEMKKHSVYGAEFIKGVKDLWDETYSKTCYEIARHHHERFDGRGYPDHLSGDDIPISAQLVSIADVYDALVSKRCYKDAYARDEAFNMIIDGKCGTFSPELIDCFKAAKEQFEDFLDSALED